MDLPEFKPSPSFIDKVQLPCLTGHVAESRLPELGLLHEETKNGKVPGFEIYLRSRKAQELSAWHRQWLQKLFEQEEIGPAIKSAMQEYEGDPSEEDFADIQTHGVLPFLVLRTVVIDEVERKILLRLGTHKDANLEEHGITIYLKRSRWRFGYADVISDYIRNLHLFEQEEQPEKAEVTTDLSSIYGRWVFDEEATAALLRARGLGSYVSSTAREMRNSSYTISEKSLRVVYNERVSEGTVVSFKFAARKLSLAVKYPQWERPVDFGGTFRNNKLTCGDFVLRREEK